MTTKRGRGNIKSAPSIKYRKALIQRMEDIVESSGCKSGIKVYGFIRRKIQEKTLCGGGHISQCLQWNENKLGIDDDGEWADGNFNRDGSAEFWEGVESVVEDLENGKSIYYFVKGYNNR